MPSLREYKVALKGAALAFIAGAHCTTQVVLQRAPKNRATTLPDELSAGLKALIADDDAVAEFTELMNEEALYPFGDLWPPEELAKLVALTKTPALNLEDPHEFNTEFKFKKGFMEALSAAAKLHYLERDEDTEVNQSLLDHWLLLVLNTAFHAGTVVAARTAKDSESFYHAITQLEEETEAWSRYSQIAILLDKEISRESAAPAEFDWDN